MNRREFLLNSTKTPPKSNVLGSNGTLLLSRAEFSYEIEHYIVHMLSELNSKRSYLRYLPSS